MKVNVWRDTTACRSIGAAARQKLKTKQQNKNAVEKNIVTQEEDFNNNYNGTVTCGMTRGGAQGRVVGATRNYYYHDDHRVKSL